MQFTQTRLLELRSIQLWLKTLKSSIRSDDFSRRPISFRRRSPTLPARATKVSIPDIVAELILCMIPEADRSVTGVWNEHNTLENNTTGFLGIFDHSDADLQHQLDRSLGAHHPG
ncbi:MAG TPA: hypothetical protein VF442_13095 [Sphingobium sp.]